MCSHQHTEHATQLLFTHWWCPCNNFNEAGCRQLTRAKSSLNHPDVWTITSRGLALVGCVPSYPFPALCADLPYVATHTTSQAAQLQATPSHCRFTACIVTISSVLGRERQLQSPMTHLDGSQSQIETRPHTQCMEHGTTVFTLPTRTIGNVEQNPTIHKQLTLAARLGSSFKPPSRVGVTCALARARRLYLSSKFPQVHGGSGGRVCGLWISLRCIYVDNQECAMTWRGFIISDGTGADKQRQAN